MAAPRVTARYRCHVHVLASIPSPTRSVWHLGPLPIRAYALCIIVGIVVALWLTTRRWKARGGDPDNVWDISAWAIVLGIIGARLYHLATDPELYFLGRAGTHPINALKIWDGGLGIWGAVAGGFLGAWIGGRRRGIRIMVYADCAVPGIIFAQAIGRLGNWFNNELYGAMTTLPWKLQIHCLNVDVGHATGCKGPGTSTVLGYFQPTFLYELIWDVAIGFVLLYLDRRFRLGRGNVMALYVMGYTLGRGWIEYLRIDHANHILGLRVNDWVSIIVFLGGLAWFLAHGRFHGGREASPYFATDADSDSGDVAGADAGDVNDVAGADSDSMEVGSDGGADR